MRLAPHATARRPMELDTPSPTPVAGQLLLRRWMWRDKRYVPCRLFALCNKMDSGDDEGRSSLLGLFRWHNRPTSPAIGVLNAGLPYLICGM